MESVAGALLVSDTPSSLLAYALFTQNGLVYNWTKSAWESLPANYTPTPDHLQKFDPFMPSGVLARLKLEILPTSIPDPPTPVQQFAVAFSVDTTMKIIAYAGYAMLNASPDKYTLNMTLQKA